MSSVVSISSDTSSGFYTGSRVVGTTIVQLMLENTPRVSRGLQIKAAATNTDLVYVGRSVVTANTDDDTDGFPLAAGEGVFIPIDDISKIYAIAAAADQKLFWLAV